VSDGQPLSDTLAAAGSVFTLAEKFDTFGRGEGYALSNLTVGADALIAETMQTYDTAGRLEDVEVGGAGVFAYDRLPGSGLASNTTLGVDSDPAGNRIVTTANAETTEYVANNLNQYAQISVPSVPSVVNPAYDADGTPFPVLIEVDTSKEEGGGADGVQTVWWRSSRRLPGRSRRTVGAGCWRRRWWWETDHLSGI